MTLRLTPEQLKHNAWRFSLSRYAQEVSGGRWHAYAWLKYLLWQVQCAVMKGGARVVISAPPRHGKSTAIAHWLPVWYLDTWPDRRVILGSYGDEFATEWGLGVREEFVRNRRTRTMIDRNSGKANIWQTTKGGGMRSMGVGGSVVGRGGDLIIVTDPHKSWMEVQSPTMRKRTRDWFDSDVYTRQEPKASIIVEHTRWHADDLTGYLLDDQGDSWTHLSFPALSEGEGDILRRPEGAPLCPERFDQEALLSIKAKPSMSSSIFAGLYQQRPTSAEGGLVKREWFRRYDSMDALVGASFWFQSWDLTFKATGTSYVVGQIWAQKGPDLYLVDQVRCRLSFPETLKQIGIMRARWPQALEIVVEEAANGAAVIDTLKEQIPGVLARRPHSSKEARLAAVSGFIESGNVYLPSPQLAPWIETFVEEVVTFPNASNDDQVDAMTMALDRFGEKTATFTNFLIPDIGVRTNPWEFAHGARH